MPSSNDLLPRATAGDSTAFLQLVEQSVAPLHLYILRHGRGVLAADFDADDVLQSTLCKAWELAGTFVPDGPGAFYRWLVTLATNQLGNRIHYVNAKGRREVEALPSAGPSGGSVAIADSITSVVSQAARRESLARADAALADMPKDERALVELTYLEGLTIRAAAERAGLPRTSALRTLQAGMARLRGALAPGRDGSGATSA